MRIDAAGPEKKVVDALAGGGAKVLKIPAAIDDAHVGVEPGAVGQGEVIDIGFVVVQRDDAALAGKIGGGHDQRAGAEAEPPPTPVYISPLGVRDRQQRGARWGRATRHLHIPEYTD